MTQTATNSIGKQAYDWIIKSHGLNGSATFRVPVADVEKRFGAGASLAAVRHSDSLPPAKSGWPQPSLSIRYTGVWTAEEAAKTGNVTAGSPCSCQRVGDPQPGDYISIQNIPMG